VGHGDPVDQADQEVHEDPGLLEAPGDPGTNNTTITVVVDNSCIPFISISK